MYVYPKYLNFILNNDYLTSFKSLIKVTNAEIVGNQCEIHWPYLQP